ASGVFLCEEWSGGTLPMPYRLNANNSQVQVKAHRGGLKAEGQPGPDAPGRPRRFGRPCPIEVAPCDCDIPPQRRGHPKTINLRHVDRWRSCTEETRS